MVGKRKTFQIAGFLIVSAFTACTILWAAKPGGVLAPRTLKVFWEELTIPGGRVFQAPLPSPDGRYLALSTEKNRGLWLFNLEKQTLEQISNQAGSGFRARWAPGRQLIAFRISTGDPRPKHEIIVAHPDGVKEIASTLERNLSLPLWRGRRIVFFTWKKGAPVMKGSGPRDAGRNQYPVPFCDPDGNILMGKEGKAVSPFVGAQGKVFFLPVLSVNGRNFVVECLDGHIYLGKTSGGDLRDLGPGSYPSFVRDDSAILFERTEDNGHTTTASRLYLLKLDTMKLEVLSDIPGVIERRPSMAEDGRTVFCDADGRIFMGILP